MSDPFNSRYNPSESGREHSQIIDNIELAIMTKPLTDALFEDNSLQKILSNEPHILMATSAKGYTPFQKKIYRMVNPLEVVTEGILKNQERAEKIQSLRLRRSQEEIQTFMKGRMRCEICGTQFGVGRYEKPYLDHNHKTKQLRGALCHQCNFMLGYARDSPDILRKAIDYLQRTEPEVMLV
jgi:hypothetical protein